MAQQGHLVTDYDLNMTLGGKFKMVLNYSENLFDYPNVMNLMDDITQSIELEFDPEDSQTFFFIIQL